MVSHRASRHPLLAADLLTFLAAGYWGRALLGIVIADYNCDYRKDADSESKWFSLRGTVQMARFTIYIYRMREIQSTCLLGFSGARFT